MAKILSEQELTEAQFVEAENMKFSHVAKKYGYTFEPNGYVWKHKSGHTMKTRVAGNKKMNWHHLDPSGLETKGSTSNMDNLHKHLDRLHFKDRAYRSF